MHAQFALAWVWLKTACVMHSCASKLVFNRNKGHYILFFFFTIRRLCTELEMILQTAAPNDELIFLMIIIEIGVCLHAFANVRNVERK